MASIINASTSGAGGLITTADNTGNLNLQSNGTTVLGVTSGGVAVTGTLSATSTISQNGTNVVAVAPGTNGNILTSNGTDWTSAAPAASGPVLKYVTDTTDITLANISSSQSNIGSSFSVNIPSTGLIRISSFAGRIQWSSVADYVSLNLGIRIGSTNYWFGKASIDGTVSYSAIVTTLTSAGYNEYYGAAMRYPSPGSGYSTTLASLCSDIAASSIPTGTQTVQLIGSYGTTYTGIGILKGTTTTTRVGIEFVSAS